MRVDWSPFVVAAAAFFLTAGCVIGPSAGSTGGGNAVPDAGPSACDGKLSCSACVTCAEGSACSQEVGACNQNSACAGIIQCYGLAGTDPNLRAQCLANAPDGVAAFNALAQCDYCTECPSDCAGMCM